MAVKSIVEGQAKPGERDALLSAMDDIAATMHDVPGFLGISRYEVLDNPDGVIEIAEWESPIARQYWLTQSMESGILEPVRAILGAPFHATVVRKID